MHFNAILRYFLDTHMTRPRKICLFIVLPLLLVCAAVVGYVAYGLALTPLTAPSGEAMLYVAPGDTLTVVLDRLPLSGSDRRRLRLAARVEGLPRVADSTTLTGAYRMGPGVSPLQLMHRVKGRLQSPVRVTFNTVRTKEELCARIARSLLMEPTDLLRDLNDSVFCRRFDTDTANVESLFLPDTYEVYWTISPEEFVEKMQQEYAAFWNADRRAKLEQLQLTPRDASILASIAEEETASRSERGVVARLYWNRLQQGMPLQADPTVKYAVGDFSLRRILHEHLQVESPYNTYRHAGLPPGPIRVCEKATLDTLLNARPHPYIYMCAQEDFSGRHNFTQSYAEHLRNAARYQRAVEQRLKKTED
jgi:UPF0755 protein